MEKELFIDVMRHYLKTSESEALDIAALKESFPYSQVLHALSARLGRDHQLVEHQRTLQSAAIYAADRSVLKGVMSGDSLVLLPTAKPVVVQHEILRINDAEPAYTFGSSSSGTIDFGNLPAGKATNGHTSGDGLSHEIPVEVPEPEQVHLPIIKDEIEEVAAPPEENALKGSFDYGARKVDVEETESVADTVMNDLGRLNQLKHDFEVLYAASKSAQQAAAADEAALSAKAETPPAHYGDEVSEPPASEKVDRLIEMDNALDNQPEQPAPPEHPKTQSIKTSIWSRRSVH